MSVTPRIAIVGRPNVGKSTLFNRLVGRRQSIVHDMPGVTRDRLFGRAELTSGLEVEVIDTGGLLSGVDVLGLNEQVMLAIEESDLVILVVDGHAGLTIADSEVGDRIRKAGKRALLVVNKSDVREAREREPEFYRMGFEPQLLLSAEHGRGIEDLRLAIIAALPSQEEPSPEQEVAPAVAIVGRPNVGKSSLLNQLVGTARALVSPIAGTTRDPIDTLIAHGDQRFLLIDTAGIRRRSRMADAPEEVAVMMARRQIERARVAVLVIDAADGVTSGDLAVADSIWELGRAAVIAINKWDLLDDDRRQHLERSYERLDEMLAKPRRINISALSGRGVQKIFAALGETLKAFEQRLSTADVNKLFETAVARHRPPAKDGHPWKLFYATQVSTAPPTFMLFANRTLAVSDPYRRYLENKVREKLELFGVPIRLVIRRR